MNGYRPRILMVHASLGGSTKGIAEFMAARLRVWGAVVDVRAASGAPAVQGYQAVVLGSAVRDQALLPVAEDFVLRNLAALRKVPVWLFSVSINPALHGPIGGLVRGLVPRRIAELRDLVGPRDYHSFAGVVPRTGVPLLTRVVLWVYGGRYGDLRDWPAIDAWTAGVAHQLATPAEASG